MKCILYVFQLKVKSAKWQVSEVPTNVTGVRNHMWQEDVVVFNDTLEKMKDIFIS